MRNIKLKLTARETTVWCLPDGKGWRVVEGKEDQVYGDRR